MQLSSARSSARARAIRAGVHELEEWARPDRSYCKSDIFKQIVLDNATASEGACRADIEERLDSCQTEICPQCVSPCNYKVAKAVATVVRCADSTRHLGFLHYAHTSDAGICPTLNPNSVLTPTHTPSH